MTDPNAPIFANSKTYIPISSLQSFPKCVQAFNKTLHFENLAVAASLDSTGAESATHNTVADMVGTSNWVALGRRVNGYDLKHYISRTSPHKWAEDIPYYPPMTLEEKLSMHLDTIASYTVERMTHLMMGGELAGSKHKAFAYGIDSNEKCTQIKHMFAGKLLALGVLANLSHMRSYLRDGGCEVKYEAKGW